MQERRKIGRYEDGNVGSLPGFRKGRRIADLQESGTYPVLQLQLKIPRSVWRRGRGRWERNSYGTKSGPQALPVGREARAIWSSEKLKREARAGGEGEDIPNWIDRVRSASVRRGGGVWKTLS
jgi:hypothetical protein